ncbi:conserved hypothetical protein [Clostridium botulinum B str. Eklund 17B (NRP)]|uniref:Uncharacterized protein n=1 Tax=Clostridium botulinum (strain Eklund 17B / Type B) TaxID=935198 RepID=B2TM12_CLOBB|nr:conserved hypothetical protein [Clostridium botulinum B str. Eklund 17B (NRP)]MCR1272654.1 hypothetical protein [Clostridium botulinum]CDH90847.1 hypothetical protein CB17B1858 [Clostridium botulinum B str. Eklund 17B (NRP)]
MENMINLETFAEGALAEKVNMALKEVLSNITDPNTVEPIDLSGIKLVK